MSFHDLIRPVEQPRSSSAEIPADALYGLTTWHLVDTAEGWRLSTPYGHREGIWCPRQPTRAECESERCAAAGVGSTKCACGIHARPLFPWEDPTDMTLALRRYMLPSIPERHAFGGVWLWGRVYRELRGEIAYPSVVALLEPTEAAARYAWREPYAAAEFVEAEHFAHERRHRDISDAYDVPVRPFHCPHPYDKQDVGTAIARLLHEARDREQSHVTVRATKGEPAVQGFIGDSLVPNPPVSGREVLEASRLLTEHPKGTLWAIAGLSGAVRGASRYRGIVEDTPEAVSLTFELEHFGPEARNMLERTHDPSVAHLGTRWFPALEPVA